MIIKEVSAEEILDSRKEKTILVSIKTTAGNFKVSAPNGKSRGKYEAKPYKKSLEEDIRTLKEFSEYFSEEHFDDFDDLRMAEDITDNSVGANTLFALESAILKAIAKEQKKEVWQVINPKVKKLPRLVGNCIGGGKHSQVQPGAKKPDFQEFLLIPETNSAIQSSDIIHNTKLNAQTILKNVDNKFEGKKNDEDAWITSLNDKTILEIMKDFKDNIMDERKLYLDEGFDAAASTFFKRKKYHYENPKLDRTSEEQLKYISNLIKNFHLLYIEDPFEENDFENFEKLLKKFPDRLIIGDDLTATNYERLKRAIKMKSINALIVKPNQTGSLLDVKRVCELAKENGIKIIFSHRSGETEENILADLAFGFGADFFKCGITGKEREAKIKRLIEIEKSIK